MFFSLKINKGMKKKTVQKEEKEKKNSHALCAEEGRERIHSKNKVCIQNKQ